MVKILFVCHGRIGAWRLERLICQRFSETISAIYATLTPKKLPSRSPDKTPGRAGSAGLTWGIKLIKIKFFTFSYHPIVLGEDMKTKYNVALSSIISLCVRKGFSYIRFINIIK